MCNIIKNNTIAYHHSGLTVDERRHLEVAFRANIICVICCTSTLAAGVNLPAKPYIGRDFITLSRYTQMVGRAGMGNKIGESILICSSIRDNTKISNLMYSAMDEACGSIHLVDGKGLCQLILSAIGLNLVNNQLWTLKPIHEVAEIFHLSLSAIVQNLIHSSTSYASCLLKCCEELNDFWAFKELLAIITKRLSYCRTVELIPLMELSCVKLARTKQLYAAGYKNLQSIAKAKPNVLVLAVEHLNYCVARQLISAAKQSGYLVENNKNSTNLQAQTKTKNEHIC